MGGFTDVVLRHRRLVAVLWLLLTVAGLAATTRLSDRLSQQFALPGQPSYQANVAIIQAYGNGGGTPPLVAVVTTPPGTTLDTPAARQALDRTFARIAAEPGLRVLSYGATGDPRLLGTDGRTSYGLIFVPPSEQLETSGPGRGPHLADLLRQDLPAGWRADITGIDELAASGDTSGSAPGVLAEALLGALGALIVLAFVFGSLLALVPLLIAGVSILTTLLLILGLAQVADVSVSVEYIVALIGLGVAIDYCLLVVSRWREELAAGHDAEQAVCQAMRTAGRSVLFSGGTVAVGLVSMVLLPVPLLRSIGYAGMLIPLVSVCATLTLLPALLATAGRRIDWPRRQRQAPTGRGWSAWAHGVIRVRWLATLAALALLFPLGLAAFGLRLGTPRADALAHSGPARTGFVALTDAGLPSGVLTPLDVLVAPGTDPDLVAGQLSRLPGVHAAQAPGGSAWRHGGTALVSVQPVAETSSAAGRQTIARVRAAAARFPGVQVGGSGPFDIDFADAIYGRFLVMLAVIAVITFLLLARAFRSLLLPAKAVVLNLLSVGAIYGVLVLVWQDGHGSGLWGIAANGSIQTFIPLMVFAFLYGLSMDYEVFMLARMREVYDRTGSTTTAIVEGLRRTGRLVTSAALILFLAFAALASGPQTSLKVFATGLGAGILLDATVVRALLVPALVSLLGRWNWWLPAWATRPLRITPSPTPPPPVDHQPDTSQTNASVLGHQPALDTGPD